MKLAVVRVTVTENWRSVTEIVFVKQGREVLGLMDMINLQVSAHVFPNCLVNCFVWRTHWLHVGWNHRNLRLCLLRLVDGNCILLSGSLLIVVNLNDLVRIVLNSLSGLVLLNILVGLHQVIGSHLICILSRWPRGGVLHIGWYHVSIVLIDRVVLVPIRVDIDLVQLVVNLWLEELLDHESSILCGKFLRKS